jgi:molecular chaperone GrpE
VQPIEPSEIMTEQEKPDQTENPNQPESSTENVDFSAENLADAPLNFDNLTENPNSTLEAENARLKDQLLRTVAEMENVRRRAAEDVTKAHKFSIEKFAENLVPVQDSLEKALQDTTGDVATLRSGVELTFKQLMSALEKSGVLELNPKGEKFDPHFHQAISMVPSDLESGMVVEVLQKGFKIADRVLRPALVIVAQ